MSRMSCKCGATIGSSECPSPYRLFMIPTKTVEHLLRVNPEISLHEFLYGDVGIVGNGDSEYLRCLECGRIYEARTQIGLHWKKIYRKAEEGITNAECNKKNISWNKITVISEKDADEATEKNFSISLRSFLQEYCVDEHLLSDDENYIAVRKLNGSTYSIAYIIEERE